MPFAGQTRPDMPPGLVVQPVPFQPTPKVVGNAAAIQTQLNRIQNGISSAVTIEGGVYVIDTPLLVPDGVGSSGIAFSVAGAGIYSTILRAAPGLVGPIMRKRTQNVAMQDATFKDFCVDGNSAAANTFGLDISGYTSANVERVKAVGTISDGINGTNSTGNATGAKITNCILDQCGGDGIHADSGGWIVSGNVIGGCAGWGYYSAGVENLITGNSIDGNLTGSVRLGGGRTTLIGNWLADIAIISLYVASIDNTIVANLFNDNGTRVTQGRCIELAADNNRILGNYFHWADVTATPQCGLFIEGTTGNVIGFNTALVDTAATPGDVAFARWNGASNGNSYIGNQYATATLASTPNDPTGIFSANLPAFAYNPVALAAITLTGSPLTYTNTQNYPQMVYGSGTATSAVSIIRNSVTTAVAGATPWSVRLEPGDAILIAYTGTPVFVRQAVR